MELYFLRHAIAEDRKPGPGHTDAERALTSDGIRKMKDAVKGMKKLEITLDRIFSSPYTRAAETAQIVSKGLGFKKKVEFTPVLASGGDYKDFLGMLKELDGDASLLFVGHQPDLSWFISHLISGNTRAAINLKKGSLCLVQTSEIGSGLLAELAWLLTAEQLGHLA